MDVIAALGIWVVLLVAGPVVLLAVVLLLKRLRSCGLAVMLSWAQRGLPLAGRDYLAKWMASWEHEFTEDLRGRGITGVPAEVSFLARILSLPFSTRSLRREAMEMTKPRPTTQVIQVEPAALELRVPPIEVEVHDALASGGGSLSINDDPDSAERLYRSTFRKKWEEYSRTMERDLANASRVIVGAGWRGAVYSNRPHPADDQEKEDKREGGVIESP